MEKIYDVFSGGQRVGSVQLRKRGLYWQFDCHCKPVGKQVFRLEMKMGDQWKSLGIPVPEGECWCLSTRIPIRQMENSAEKFRLTPLGEAPKGRFLPVYEQQPFPELSRVRKGKLAIRDGVVGILLE